MEQERQRSVTWSLTCEVGTRVSIDPVAVVVVGVVFIALRPY